MMARITIASTTQDATCVYARRGKNRIHYRAVDEHDGDRLSARRTRASARPLTLGELEAFFNGAWSIFEVPAMDFAGHGYVVAEMQSFVVSASSEFYPQLGTLCRQRIDDWAADHRDDADEDAGEEYGAAGGK